MKKIIFALLCVLLVGIVILGCAKPGPAPAPAPAPVPPAKAIELKAVSWLPNNIDQARFIGIFADRVTKRSNGQLNVTWVGGPEVIPPNGLADAVRKGVVDIVSCPGSFYQSEVPEMRALAMSEYTVSEERQRGLTDLINKVVREKINAYYMGKLQDNTPFYLFTNVEAKKPEDLNGAKFAGGPAHNDFMKALGIVPVTVEDSEVYSAMERKIVMGFATVYNSVVGMKTYEVTKHWVDHGFYDSMQTMLINLDSYNKLPKNLQDLVNNVMIEMEPEISTYFAEGEGKMRKILETNGMTPLTFSPADAKRYVDLSYSARWEATKDKLTPEMYAKLRELETKPK